jgi:HEAT repeats
MNESPLDDLPNPFASVLQSANPQSGSSRNSSTHNPARYASKTKSSRATRPKRSGFRSNLIRLAWIGVALVALLTLVNRGPQFLANHLMKDFASLESAKQHQRLMQVASLGQAGIKPLVDQLASPAYETSQLAHTLLSEIQNSWITLNPSDARKRHQMLVDSIESISAQLDERQTALASRLVTQSLEVSRKDTGEDGMYLARRCDEVLERLSIPQNAGPIALNAEALDPTLPARIAVQPKVIPGDETFEESSSNDPLSSDEPSIVSSGSSTIILKSGSLSLTPLDEDETISLRDINEELIVPVTETAHHVPPASEKPLVSPVSIQQVSSPPLTSSPVESLVDESIYPLLHHDQPSLREAAEIELRSRGYQERELHLAAMAGSPQIEDRIALVDHLANLDESDPRPWLRRMLHDGHRDVRLRAISVIATMNDPDAMTVLRLRLAQEGDTTVAARLRRVLDLR